MSDAEVALGLLKLVLEKCPDALVVEKKKEQFLSLYHECLAAVATQPKATE